jgi:septal ring factor EnvC (AmiA/AmiB activator)
MTGADSLRRQELERELANCQESHRATTEEMIKAETERRQLKRELAEAEDHIGALKVGLEFYAEEDHYTPRLLNVKRTGENEVTGTKIPPLIESDRGEVARGILYWNPDEAAKRIKAREDTGGHRLEE